MRAPGWVLKKKKTRPNYDVQQGILKLREMRAKKQNFFVRENELFVRISEYSIFFNAFERKVDWNGLQKFNLEFSCDFGEESVYVRGLWSMLAIFLCIATYSCINLRSDDDTAAQIALKLINRKRNQHQISVIIYLFIYSFLAFALQTVRLSYTCSHFSKSGKTYTYIQWTHLATFCQPPYSILTG